ncbi:hypothetical protein F511_33408 [Dorcoceras hygrometricum]|uniref:Uncharacterized protein n=1 Tax=Dorcoceras hygrometricum TaxID=472368 RepID=A0A2Z7AZ68_9LAMI|nr:hypothetical protein F511_33408 [Dorcoceras hygrometricum]
MRTSSNKKSSRRNDRKEDAHCLMADHASDDEVFDFANTEFTREDLVQALNDMVHEYKTLSHTFEEIKAENAKEEDDERTVERSKDKSKDKFKDRSKDMRMKIKSDKRPSRRNDRKVLVAEESTKSWADSDSESSSSSSSSSDSEQEEVHCLMANQTDKDELEDVNSLNTELSRLKRENYLLRSESSELKAEVEKLTKEMSSWTQSARAFQKLQEIQNSALDRTGLGFSNSESCEGETSTQSQPVYDKFNKMGFVKADVIYDCCESIRYDDQKPFQPSHEEKENMASAIKGLRVPSPAG